MGILDYVILGLRSLAIITDNPALGGGSNLKFNEASSMLATLAELAAKGKEGLEELKTFTEIIRRMSEENRPPSREEWAFLRARSDAAHARLQAAKRRFDDVTDPADEIVPEEEKPEEPEQSPAEKLVDAHTKEELFVMAGDREIDLPASSTKAEIAEAIVAHDAENKQE